MNYLRCIRPITPQQRAGCPRPRHPDMPWSSRFNSAETMETTIPHRGQCHPIQRRSLHHAVFFLLHEIVDPRNPQKLRRQEAPRHDTWRWYGQ